MMVRTPHAIESLKKLARWVEKLDDVKEADEHQAVNAVVGCLRIMAQSPTTHIREWFRRQRGRKKLKTPMVAVRSPEGRRAISELIALTITELEASQSFRREVEVGPLPVEEPRRLSEATHRCLGAGTEEAAGGGAKKEGGGLPLEDAADAQR